MEYPEYFNEIEVIVLKDELSKFLGVNKDGRIEITYLDIVKMAGHSCPTVGEAYLIALKGLKALYPDDIPERGGIKVELKKSPTEDNAGNDDLKLKIGLKAYGNRSNPWRQMLEVAGVCLE